MFGKDAFRPHFFSFGAGLLVAFLIAVLTTAASPGLSVGVADNNAFMTPDQRGSQAAADLGLNSIRLFLWYEPGQTSLSGEQRTQLAWALAPGRRTLVSVTGQPVRTDHGWRSPRGISSAAGRRAYVAFLHDLVHSFPAIRDVSVWNEPNYPLFWANRTRAPQRYAALLAAAYDALHAKGVRVYGFELHPWRETQRWVEGVGRWLRASHRRRPLFDFVATHPYPRVPSEAPWVRHERRTILGMGDIQRLRSLLRRSFAHTPQKRLEIAYTETGWTTAPRVGITPQLQAKRMVQALELAYSQRGVRFFMSFLLADDPDFWQTGFISNGWSGFKPVYWSYRDAIRRIRTGQVNSAQFPSAVL